MAVASFPVIPQPEIGVKGGNRRKFAEYKQQGMFPVLEKHTLLCFLSFFPVFYSGIRSAMVSSVKIVSEIRLY